VIEPQHIDIFATLKGTSCSANTQTAWAICSAIGQTNNPLTIEARQNNRRVSAATRAASIHDFRTERYGGVLRDLAAPRPPLLGSTVGRPMLPRRHAGIRRPATILQRNCRTSAIATPNCRRTRRHSGACGCVMASGVAGREGLTKPAIEGTGCADVGMAAIRTNRLIRASPRAGSSPLTAH
jgi:hypothetical protein